MLLFGRCSLQLDGNVHYLIVFLVGTVTRVARIVTRMARTVTRMARWLAH